MRTYVGLDLGVTKTAICVVDASGKVRLRSTVMSEPCEILGKLATLGDRDFLVGLEACPLSEWIYGAVRDAGHEVVCLETRHSQRFLSSRPNKTDRSDARGIAEMLRIGHYKTVHVKSVESQVLRAILTGRKQLMGALLQIENTLRSLMRVRGLKLGRVHRRKYAQTVVEMLEDAPELKPAIEPLLAAREALREEVRLLSNRLERMARRDPVTKLFQTIPGVGPQTSIAFKATIDDPSRFSRSRTVAAHIGLTPRVYQSGETDRSGRISRCGDKLLRYLLVEAASCMLLVSRKQSELKDWAIELSKRVGKPKAIVALARKLAIIMHRMWTLERPFDPGPRYAAAPVTANRA